MPPGYLDRGFHQMSHPLWSAMYQALERCLRLVVTSRLSPCLQLILRVRYRSGSLLWLKTLLSQAAYSAVYWFNFVHLVSRTGFTLRSLYKITLTSAPLCGSSFTYASFTKRWLTFAICCNLSFLICFWCRAVRKKSPAELVELSATSSMVFL